MKNTSSLQKKVFVLSGKLTDVTKHQFIEINFPKIYFSQFGIGDKNGVIFISDCNIGLAYDYEVEVI